MNVALWVIERMPRVCRPRLIVAANTGVAALTANTATLQASLNRAGAHFCEEDHVTDLLTVKRGDTAPPLTLTLTDDGAPVDLSTATRIRVIGVAGGTAVIDDPGLTGSDVGVVVRPWLPAETATVREYQFEVEVTWSDTTIRTFPADGALTVRVVPDLA